MSWQGSPTVFFRQSRRHSTCVCNCVNACKCVSGNSSWVTAHGSNRFWLRRTCHDCGRFQQTRVGMAWGDHWCWEQAMGLGVFGTVCQMLHGICGAMQTKTGGSSAYRVHWQCGCGGHPSMDAAFGRRTGEDTHVLCCCPGQVRVIELATHIVAVSG